MSKSKLTVSGLALLLAKLARIDINVLARAANIPLDNVHSWLGGNIRGLRVATIVTLMGMLGLKLDNGSWKLDHERVHFWHVDLSVFAKGEHVVESLQLLSRLMSGVAITQILPPKSQSGARGLWRTDYFMLGSETCRVVVSVKRPVFRRLRLTPDVIKGALWRDDNKHHTMLIPASHWAHVVRRDLTPKEFDQAFNESLRAMDWGDLALSARQYNLTPEDLLGWVRDRCEPVDPNTRGATADTDIEMPVSGRVIMLGHTTEPRVARTGTYG